ncbi:unnamed protein product [Cylicocyclus nassatus]|uniref:Uncharacterized protein n=1 Tax=Cylicocyclus nassatus TaxID=53992 RepID=A0AA36GNR8_CYLNA|nr:unnamed protein product [Cylicocyclus nassatus]
MNEKASCWGAKTVEGSGQLDKSQRIRTKTLTIRNIYLQPIVFCHEISVESCLEAFSVRSPFGSPYANLHQRSLLGYATTS